MFVSHNAPRVSRAGRAACAIFALAATTGAPIFAQSSAVTSKLSAWKVEEKDGREQLVSAAKVAPGDVVEYRVEYRNGSSRAVRDLAATLPIPSSVTYLERSTRPSAAQASLNGRLFAPLPLRRRVKGADGATRVVVVPAAQYRFLRWKVPALAAGQSVAFVARVRVNR